MKTIEELRQEYMIEEVFTTKEFEELMKPLDGIKTIEFVDSYGYFHDGENITDIAVDPYTFEEYKDKYPYVIWRSV